MNIAISEYNEMIDCIEHQDTFDIEWEINRHFIQVHSLNVGDGDYAIIKSFTKKYGDSAYRSSPYQAKEFLDKYSTYDKFIDEINRVFVSMRAEKWKPLDGRIQLSLFD